MMKNEINKSIRLALKEDQSHKDITTRCLVHQTQISRASIITREPCVVSGLEVVAAIFRHLDAKIKIQYHRHDGDRLEKNQKIVSFCGRTRALLTGERVALNYLSYLSGVATLTQRFVSKVADLPVKIMDTRKTIPGLRSLVKMSVRHGGGINHRFNLKEMVIIKDNHLVAYESDSTVKEAILHVRRRTKKMIVAEVDNLSQFKQAIEANPDIILLDNMNTEQMRKAVAYKNARSPKVLLEASGGVNLRSVRSIALTGVDRISIGALTHSPNAVDFSMEFEFGGA